MSAKTYNAGVKEYRHTYWEPHYNVQDTDILACFKSYRNLVWIVRKQQLL